MRKKYLSALLFGALLLASAGTFTSCKDYDDDIKNLQEQINTVKTSLDELTTKVNNLGAGIKDFKYENGQLVIVTDKDTNFTVDLPACEGIVKLEIKDGVLYADGVAVGNVTGDGGSVVEVKDGVIYIDGKAQGELGNKVAVVDNGNGTYTLTVDGKEYVLPKASSTVVVNLVADGFDYFTNCSYLKDNNDGGIVWGKAINYNGKWAGLKPVVKDGLLVGPISEVSVNVLPATFDLSTAKLTLVNSLGETAPVKVTPVADGNGAPAVAGSRAASTNGQWNLQLAMDEAITLDNIATAFATGKESTDANIGYALAVDGKVVTPYNIVVDTKTAVEVNSISNFDNIKIQLNGKDIVDNTTVLPLGEATLELTYASVSSDGAATDFDKVYDAYIELTNKDYAESHEITASGMTISSTDKAAAADKVKFKVHVLDVTGYEVVSQEYTLKMASSTVPGEAIADQTYTLAPNVNYVLVDLGNTFTGLTADQAEAISKVDGANNAVAWKFADGAKTFKSTVSGVTYYASLDDVKKSNNIDVTDGDVTTIRTIKYAVIPLANNLIANASEVIYAEEGDNKATITLKDNAGNEVKKVNATITVALPKFDDLVAPNTEHTTWADGAYVARLFKDTNAKISFTNAFVSKEDASGNDYYSDAEMKGNTKLTYELTYVDPADETVKSITASNLNALIDATAGKLNVTSLNAKVSATIVEGQPNLKVSKEYTVNLKSIFEGAELTYYGEDNKATTVVDLSTTGNLIKDGKIVDATKNLCTGLFVSFNSKTVAFTAAKDVLAGNVTIDVDETNYANLANASVLYGANLAKGSHGELDPSRVNGFQINNCPAGNSGTLVITFTDALGIKTQYQIGYKK